MKKIKKISFLLINLFLYSCVSDNPSQTRNNATNPKTSLWSTEEAKIFNDQCQNEISVLRLDLNPSMIVGYCACAFSQVQERYSFQQLRISVYNDPQIQNINQICSIEANLPPDPADFGGPSFGGRCDNAGSYQDKLICLGLPIPVLQVVPWRR